MDIIPYALRLLGQAVFAISLIFAGLFFLRVIVAWVSANPFSWLAYNLRRVTEPMVLPIRQQFGGRHFRFDLLPLVAGAMIIVIGSFSSSLLLQLANITQDAIYTAVRGVVTVKFIARILVGLAGLFYLAAILLRVFLPDFMAGYRSSLLLFAFKITEPLLRPLRKIFVAGMFDFSPFVALLIVQFATRVLTDYLQ